MVRIARASERGLVRLDRASAIRVCANRKLFWHAFFCSQPRRGGRPARTADPGARAGPARNHRKWVESIEYRLPTVQNWFPRRSGPRGVTRTVRRRDGERPHGDGITVSSTRWPRFHWLLCIGWMGFVRSDDRRGQGRQGAVLDGSAEGRPTAVAISPRSSRFAGRRKVLTKVRRFS